MIFFFKILLLSNCKEDEAEIWYTCIGHCPLQKLRFLFLSDKNSDYEDMEEGFAIDLCSKKVLESCAVTHSCLDFFSTCIHEKAGFQFSNKSSAYLLMAFNVIYHMM